MLIGVSAPPPNIDALDKVRNGVIKPYLHSCCILIGRTSSTCFKQLPMMFLQNGRSPLMLAAELGRADMVAALLSANPPPTLDFRTKSALVPAAGKTLLELAATEAIRSAIQLAIDRRSALSLASVSK